MGVSFLRYRRRKGATYISDIRTGQGKLIGKLNEQADVLQIKAGIKTTLIEIPASGLKIHFISGNNEAEEIIIPPPSTTTIIWVK